MFITLREDVCVIINSDIQFKLLVNSKHKSQSY